MYPISVFVDEVMLTSWEIRVLAEGEEAPEGMSSFPFKQICFSFFLFCDLLLFLEEKKSSSSSSASEDGGEGDGNGDEKPAEVPEPEPEAQPVVEEKPVELQGLFRCIFWS